MWCVWHDMWSGYYEFICGRARATELLDGGMTKINGRPCQLEIVGEWPELDAVQIRAHAPVEERESRYEWEIAA